MTDISNKIASLEKLIGNTPLIEILCEYKGKEIKVYTKLEYYNYSGSIKDRMALYILKNAYKHNKIKEGDIIIEATSGNTGISFAALGTYLNHPVEIYMPDWMSDERKKLLKSFGAEIHLVSKKDGGFLKCISLAEERAKCEKNIFIPSQFSNEDNPMAHYLSTGPEIYHSLKSKKLKPDAFVAGVGTGGTIMGIGRYLKNKNPHCKVYPLEPSNSPTLSTKSKVCEHRIQGIVDEFIPDILKFNETDDIVSVDDGDAIIMAQKLSSELGLGVGISSGANFLGAIKALEILGYNSTVVTVFADDNKKYLTTDLMNKEPVKPGFLSTDIKLLKITRL